LALQVDDCCRDQFLCGRWYDAAVEDSKFAVRFWAARCGFRFRDG
jgi:hypothetical protein